MVHFRPMYLWAFFRPFFSDFGAILGPYPTAPKPLCHKGLRHFWYAEALIYILTAAAVRGGVPSYPVIPILVFYKSVSPRPRPSAA